MCSPVFRKSLFGLVVFFIFSALFLPAPTAHASSLYTDVPVSDGFTDNSFNSPNTSRKVATAPNGIIYIVYHGASAGIRVTRSTNRGQSFSASVQVTSTNAEAEIAVDANNIVYVAWGSGSNVQLSRSTDNGVTFSAPVALGRTYPGGLGDETAHIALDAPYVYIINPSGNVLYRNAASGVGSFTTTSINTVDKVFADVQVNPVTGYVFVIADNPTIYYATSTDRGLTFGTVNNTGTSVSYSIGVLTSNSSSEFLLIAGAGSTARKINLNTNTSTALTLLNNSSSQGRTLAADNIGNVVDGFVSGTAMMYEVSANQASSFAAPVIVTSSATYVQVAINQLYGDIVATFVKSGVVYASVYQGEISQTAAQANLAVAITGPATTTAGNTAAFTVTVHNGSYSAANALIVTTTLPTGFTFSTSSPSCSTSGNDVMCSLSSLSAGATSTFYVTTTVGSSLSGVYTVTSTASSTTADPDSSNNTATVTTTVSGSPTISAVSGTAAATSVTIAWTTDQGASSIVSYGLTASYGTVTAEADTSPAVSSHTVTLSNLAACTGYHYAVTSRNINGSATSSDGTFTTTNCPQAQSGSAGITIAPQAATSEYSAQSSAPASVRPPLAFSINNGSTVPVISPLLTLSFNGDPTLMKGYSVALDPDFTQASILSYTGTTTFTLPNIAGTYRVYMKYISLTGQSSAVLSQTVTYRPASAAVPRPPSVVASTPAVVSKTVVVAFPHMNFSRNLKFGDKGGDVIRLQQYLNENGFRLETEGPGSRGRETRFFRAATEKALIRFQEANAAAILQPLGLTKGSGILGALTRKFIATR